MITALQKLPHAPTWPTTQVAKAEWVAASRDPRASPQDKAKKRREFVRLMRRCLREVGIDDGRDRSTPTRHP